MAQEEAGGAGARPGGSTVARSVRSWAPHILTVALIWLGWQIVVSLLVQRAPVEAAVRVAPSSPQTLSRAAEAELVAGRVEPARELAAMALRASPFDVRALRVYGLAVARADADAADPLLTLAGNWSLRDDPSHAWLVGRRLEQGDYAGAFGHADALLRRRPDLQGRLFELFTVAATEDPRAIPHLVARLAARPNWRTAYLQSLRRHPRGPQVQAVVAQGLERTEGRMTTGELEILYNDWASLGRLPGLRELSARLRRPAPAPLQDGGFDGPPIPKPFAWSLEPAAGLLAALSERPDGEGQALFVETDGFASAAVARQLLFLNPGAHRLSGAAMFEAGGDDPRLTWSIRCIETGQVFLSWKPSSRTGASTWTRSTSEFTVPAQRCTAQWLELVQERGPGRTTIIAWYDDLKIEPIGASASGR